VTTNVTLILTTVPDADSAQKLAFAVLDARLAACVTELGTVRSTYHWQGKRETSNEVQMLFKTGTPRALELERFILAHHPYDVPELLSWQAAASEAYGQWVAAETHRTVHV
jgi:periplasmic divalent cation tolerance protein